jgi:diguanylate cyclase (GGDEF)-like protein
MNGMSDEDPARLRHFWYDLSVTRRLLIVLPVYLGCIFLVALQIGSDGTILTASAAVFAMTVSMPLVLGSTGAYIALAACVVGIVNTSIEYQSTPSTYHAGVIATQIGAIVAVVLIDYLHRVNQTHLKELSLQAVTDALTGLYNRRTFEVRLAEEWARAERSDSPLALMITDVDEFKAINDSRGHHFGDVALKEYARVIRETCRVQDTAYRIGGDEFALILPETDAPGAEVVAERIRLGVARSSVLGSNRDIPVTVSLGVSAAPDLASDSQTLFLQADAALYQVKHRGRDGVRVFADVFEDLARRNGHDGSSLSRVKALLWAAASKDRYTYAHSERVGSYVVKIAQALGLPDEFVERLYLAGLTCDVGTYRIDRSILIKDGPLADDEWDAIRQHPADGADIASDIDHSGEVKRYIRHHHERFDGTGYPDGLQGNQIPLGARILAIADAFDAMTTARPYRSGFDRGKAYEELRKAAGSHFDPALVPKAIEVFAADETMN